MGDSPFEELPIRELFLKKFAASGMAESDYSPIETTRVPDWEDATHLIGAMFYLAILAYPLLDQIEKRDDLVDGLRALYSKTAIAEGVRKRQQVAKQLMEIPNQQINGRLSRAEKRIAKRFKMSRIYGFVKLQGHFSGDASMTRYFRESTASDESKIRMLMRDWATTKPVLHLASPLFFELSTLFPSHDPPNIYWSIEGLLFQADKWVRKLIYQAENNRLLFADDSTIKANQQVSLLYPDMP